MLSTRSDILVGPDGRSKGCGIVEYQTVEESIQAIQQLNDSQLLDRCA